ncbi:MAG: lipocalin-like domain-containing protein, partial [Pseudomonadota bacterium]
MKQFTGVWRLISSEFRTSNDDVIYPLGDDATGLAIFTESGHMSAQLMKRNRPVFVNDSPTGGSDEETVAAFRGYIAYYGRCDINEEEKTLITHVEGSLFPNWVAGKQLRFYRLSEDQLTLTTPPIPLGDLSIVGEL